MARPLLVYATDAETDTLIAEIQPGLEMGGLRLCGWDIIFQE